MVFAPRLWRKELNTNEVLDEVRELAKGGAFGSIMGRNAFQRPKKEAVQLIHSVMDIFTGHE